MRNSLRKTTLPCVVPHREALHAIGAAVVLALAEPQCGQGATRARAVGCSRVLVASSSSGCTELGALGETYHG